MASPILQFKRGLLANLPALQAGEPAFTTDSNDLFIGLSSETSTNKFFGSHRYWTKETTSTGSGLNLVEGTSNGSSFITIKSPDSLAGIITYYMPGTQGASASVLTNDGSGNLTWSSGSANPVFTGIATFTDTTDNTLGDANTGSVQFDGGFGVNKNVTVGANLNVQGYSEFVGVSTFGSDLDINASIDVDGHTELDDVNVSGVSTFVGTLNANGNVSVAGISTLNNVTVGGATTALIVDGDARVIGVLTVGSASVTFSGVNNEIAGVTTFTGLSDFNADINVDGHSELDNVNVSGIVTAASVVFGSGTAITSVDTDLSSVSASDDTLASAKAIKSYIDSQVTAQDLDFAGDFGTGAVDLDSQSLTIAGTASEIVTSASGQTITIGLPDNVVVGASLTVTGALDVNGGGTIDNIQIGVSGDNEIDTTSGNLIIDSADGTVTIDDDLAVTGVSTFTGAIDANGGADISGGETTLSSATVSDLTSGRVVLAGTSGSLEDSANLTFGSGGLIVGANGINVTGVSTFSTDVVVGGDIRLNGNDVKASDGNTNITLTSNTLTTFSGDIKVSGNDIQSSDGSTAITMSSTNVTVGGDLTVGGNDIKASDGATALTLANSTGAVTTANDLTVSGNLYVSGNTTQVNTAALTVEDRTIDIGIVNGATPSTATTWDLGVLFNYHSGGSAKKSAVIWEHGDTRFKFASVLSADTNGSNSDTPQLSVTTFAPIEVGALWVNDCAGSSQVISCTGNERFLENITIDAGTF